MSSDVNGPPEQPPADLGPLQPPRRPDVMQMPLSAEGAPLDNEAILHLQVQVTQLLGAMKNLTRQLSSVDTRLSNGVLSLQREVAYLTAQNTGASAAQSLVTALSAAESLEGPCDPDPSDFAGRPEWDALYPPGFPPPTWTPHHDGFVRPRFSGSTQSPPSLRGPVHSDITPPERWLGGREEPAEPPQ